MIKMKDLNKYYFLPGKKRLRALNDVNLEINSGEFLSIEGKSGAGKSTLLHIIGCLDNFDRGEYLFEGDSVGELKDSKLASIRNSKIGFVMQDFGLISQESVLFNVMLPLFFSKEKYSVMKEKAYVMTEKLGIEDQLMKKVCQLSGGQKQRVAIGRALISGCSVILADEPTGALDTKTGYEIMEVLDEINKKENTTVIVVTHDPTVSSFARRKVVISDGLIVDDIEI